MRWAKSPRERYTSAEAMANDLRQALMLHDSGTVTRPRVLSRLLVLPFRNLRPNADTDFLAFSLPDAITSSLSGLGSLIVRSSVAAARFAGDSPNLKTIAEEADVDVVLTGTILASGRQLRVSTQLVEVPSGALLWSKMSQAAVRDVFQVQDELVDRIVESLSLPLDGSRAPALKTRRAGQFHRIRILLARQPAVSGLVKDDHRARHVPALRR